MKCIFLLSGDYIKLSKEEVTSLFNVEECKLLDRLLIAKLKNNEKIPIKLSQRLALAKSIYKLLFECKNSELIDFMKNYDWNSIYKDNFCLRVHYFNNKKTLNKKPRTTSINKHDRSKPFVDKSHWDFRSCSEIFDFRHVILSEKDLAKYIWYTVKNPKVNLENPKTKIELFFYKNNVYCGLLVKEFDADFESRKSHLRPFSSPSSLHPKLARALVNLTGIENNEILLDPFCGTGGFLIEAGLLKIKTIGYDVNKTLTDGCKENLKHFKIKNYKIKNKNALSINDRFDYVVTDLPYGLNSNVYLEYNKNSLKNNLNKINLKINKQDFIKNLENFYLKFLKNLRKKLKKKAVIVFPHYVNYKKLLKMSKFKIEKEFSVHVHRSLTRKITLLKTQ